MSHSDQNTPNLHQTFPRYGRGMEAGKPCAARMFHTFHTFQTYSPAACAYGCERAPARTRTRVHLSLFMYGRYGRYGRGPQDKGLEAPYICHTSNRYGKPAEGLGQRVPQSNTGTASADSRSCQRRAMGVAICKPLGSAGPSTGLLHTGQKTPVCPLLFSPTKGVM